MTLLILLAQIAFVVVVLLSVAIIVVADNPRAVLGRATTRLRNRTDAPYLGLLVAVLAISATSRWVWPDAPWLIGWELTGIIYALEGAFVAWIQQFASLPVTAYFSFMYIFGYVFLLVFPLIIYAGLEDPAPLRETAVAYSVNFAIGLLSFVFFVAYGPRTLIPELVEPLLYTTWPDSQLVTSQMRTNSNVFPSLRTSLSVTVALLAVRTRGYYRRWLPLAVVLAASIVLSTMYLGMNWVADVVAGAVLAILSVAIATRVQLPT